MAGRLGRSGGKVLWDRPAVRLVTKQAAPRTNPCAQSTPATSLNQVGSSPAAQMLADRRLTSRRSSSPRTSVAGTPTRP
jgi:hypothetical protein